MNLVQRVQFYFQTLEGGTELDCLLASSVQLLLLLSAHGITVEECLEPSGRRESTEALAISLS